MHRRVLLLYLYLFIYSVVGSTDCWAEISGRVMLNDSTPAAFASVYVPKIGVGTTTNHEGFFVLEDLEQGVNSIEVSYLGYETATMQLEESDDCVVMLHEQPVNLNEVFVTPHGEDPAVFIMNKLKETSKANDKSIAYQATANLTYHTQDLDVIPILLPKALLWILKKSINITGLGSLFEYSIEHQELTVKAEYKRSRDKGSSKRVDWQLLSSSNPIDRKVEDCIRKSFEMDPFSAAYDEFKQINPKKSGYRLVGTTEEDGKVIDVLEHKEKHTTTTIYVVENDWGILRKEIRFGKSLYRTECREIFPHLWLPISFIDDPETVDMNLLLEEAVKQAEEERKKGDKPGRMERKTLERIQQVIEGDRHFYPCMTTSYSFKYK